MANAPARPLAPAAPDAAVERRIDELLARMTPEEKAGQLNQRCGGHLHHLDAVRQGHVGSILFAEGPDASLAAGEIGRVETLNTLQRAAVEETRLGIPILFGRDVIHGHRVVFPIPLAQAAAFDPDGVRDAYRHTAAEARANGVHWTFAPMVDIARDARWGRMAESFGEEPHLAGACAAASVRGLQGDGPADLARPDRMAACLKHFAAYGAAEAGRDYAAAEIGPRLLRNVYLKPFAAGVAAGAATLMSAFNDIDGTPASIHRGLLTDVLRGEWGFDGFVVSDWESVKEVLNHRAAKDAADAARLGLEAGVDMDMVDGLYLAHLPRLVAEGVVPMAALDEAVRRILRIKFRVGLFDRPYFDADAAPKALRRPEALAHARALAAKSMVLLKNDGGLLPLAAEGGPVALVGALAAGKRELFGTWTLDGVAGDVVPVDAALAAALPKRAVKAQCLSSDAAPSTGMDADAIVAVIGEDPLRSGEASSVTDVGLPPGQLEFMRSLRKLGRPVVAVVLAGRALALEELLPYADAILVAWHPGVEGGHAVADVLTGKVNPSGRLPVSFPRATGQCPVYLGRKSTGRPADGVKPFRFLSRYLDCPPEPLFPFGFGKSYTTFAYGEPELSKAEVAAGEAVEVRVKVTNTGPRAGEEVAQCYVRDDVATISRPRWELAGFARLSLAPGETKEAVFRLDREAFAFWKDEKEGWVIEPGTFTIRTAGSGEPAPGEAAGAGETTLTVK